MTADRVTAAVAAAAEAAAETIRSWASATDAGTRTGSMTAEDLAQAVSETVVEAATEELHKATIIGRSIEGELMPSDSAVVDYLEARPRDIAWAIIQEALGRQDLAYLVAHLEFEVPDDLGGSGEGTGDD